MKVVLSLLFLALAGCATLSPNFTEPEARLVSFAPVPGQGLEQRFKLGIRITNPNTQPLHLKGMSYALELNGHKVVSGVNGNAREVPAYGEEVINLEVGASLFGGARFILDMVQSNDGKVAYTLQTKLSVNQFLPPITLEEKGELAFAQ